MGIKWKDGYSADIDLYLIVDGEKLPVAQVGPNSFILQEPLCIPPGTAGELVIVIDGNEDRRHVVMQRGSLCELEPVSYF